MRSVPPSPSPHKQEVADARTKMKLIIARSIVAALMDVHAANGELLARAGANQNRK